MREDADEIMVQALIEGEEEALGRKLTAEEASKIRKDFMKTLDGHCRASIDLSDQVARSLTRRNAIY